MQQTHEDRRDAKVNKRRHPNMVVNGKGYVQLNLAAIAKACQETRVSKECRAKEKPR